LIKKNTLDFLKAFGKSKFGVGENVFGAGDGDDPNQSHSMRVDDLRAVIIMNAHCIIQMANKGAYTIFGYSKKVRILTIV
jgi:hypothetical protein